MYGAIVWSPSNKPKVTLHIHPFIHLSIHSLNRQRPWYLPSIMWGCREHKENHILKWFFSSRLIPWGKAWEGRDTSLAWWSGSDGGQVLGILEEGDLILTGMALEGFLEEVMPEEWGRVWKPKQALSPRQVGVMEGGHGTPQTIFFF